jgi:hypothetical protein
MKKGHSFECPFLLKPSLCLDEVDITLLLALDEPEGFVAAVEGFATVLLTEVEVAFVVGLLALLNLQLLASVLP